jgi:type VI secretion system secreted protein Hcp
MLKLDGVDGDSHIPKYEKWISCTSASWDVTREPSESAKTGTLDVNLGNAEIPAIELGKTMDASSVYLMQAAVSGGALGKEAKIHFLTTGGDKANLYLEFKLFNPIVTKWAISGSDDGRPEENISLWYWKIWMQYYTTTDGKSFTSAGSRGWDRVKNEPWSG